MSQSDDQHVHNAIQQYTPSSRVMNQEDLEAQLYNEDEEVEYPPLARTLSRPPSYIPPQGQQTTLSSADLAHRQRHLEILSELGEYYYRQERKSHYLNRLLFCNTTADSQNLSYKDAVCACLEDQFKGILMAFWIIVFIFVGAISVFVPSLPRGSQAMWIPLILYMLTAFILFRHRYKQSVHIDQLERQVLEERRRRRRQDLENVEPQQQIRPLPNGYFFEIHYDDKEHTHPYRTLLKPPPIYTKDDVALHTIPAAASIA